jgi:hypothetical protein
MRSLLSSRLVTGAVLLAALGAGCSKDPIRSPVSNQLPTVRITAAPIDTTVRCTPDPAKSCYSLTLQWVGNDPDGRVDHYLFAIDPPTSSVAETTWSISRSNQERLTFEAGSSVSVVNGLPVARDFHVFVIKAVDNHGAAGPPVSRSFFSYTQAPDVYLTSPQPSHLNTLLLVPSVRFTWTGTDEDGVFHSKPVKYKYRLFTQSDEFPMDVAISNPDSLRRFYAPDFAGWDSVGGDTNTVRYTNLSPGQLYLFVVVGFDEAGAYSPIFNLDTNMLRFLVGYTGVLGPKITIFNEFFNYSWRGGWCPTCPNTEFYIEVPAGRRVTFNWVAEPPTGAVMRCYRWALDMEDANDDTPRLDEFTDLAHWSTCGLNSTSCTIGPFAGSVLPDPPEEHRFYVSAEDDLGLKSLAIVRFQVVRASLTPGTVLVVKDTRLKPDNVPRGGNCVERPRSGVPWPNQAELDTFLFARGGNQWKCLAPGITSTPGLFADYLPVDSVGTRINKTDLTVRLSKLGRYEHVIWIVDPGAAVSSEPGDDPIAPQTALRYMCDRGRFNTLGAYVKQGGKVWLLGGGGGYAATRNFGGDVSQEGGTTFGTNVLRPGRLMYDLARWQSEFRATSLPADPTRFAGRFQSRPGAAEYTHHLAELPTHMEYKSRQTDPRPPTRDRDSDFYRTVVTAEFMDLANQIVEDVSEDPEHTDEQSVLDTLYAEGGVRYQQDRRILMTYYHGPTVPQGFLFSGFDIWTWQRSQCQSLVDFVLTRIWNVPRHPSAAALTARRPGEEAAAWGAAARAASRSSGRPIRRPVPVPVTRP